MARKMTTTEIVAEILSCEVYVMSEGYTTEYHALYGQEWSDMTADERDDTDIVRETTVRDEVERGYLHGLSYCLTGYSRDNPAQVAEIEALIDDMDSDAILAFA